MRYLSVLPVAFIAAASFAKTPAKTASANSTTGQPTIFQNPLSNAAAGSARKKRNKKNNSQSSPPQMPNLGGAGTGGGRSDDANKDDAGVKGAGAPGGSGGGDASTDGSMQDCGTLPAGVQKDLDQMLEFRKNCPAASAAMNKNMALNEYKCPGTPTMYLFDAAGTCLKKMAISFGAGKGRTTSDTQPSGCPQTCTDDDKSHPASGHYTPAGFHLTATHFGKDKYGPENSLGLNGLEGQGSQGRGILIHGANAPGTASSWGCTGVSHNNLMYVLNQLGPGALVYNAFDKGQLASTGTNAKGLDHNASACQTDGGGSAPAGGGGSSGPGATSK